MNYKAMPCKFGTDYCCSENLQSGSVFASPLSLKPKFAALLANCVSMLGHYISND